MFSHSPRSIGTQRSSTKSFPLRSRRRARSGVFSNTLNSEQRYLRILGSIRKQAASLSSAAPIGGPSRERLHFTTPNGWDWVLRRFGARNLPCPLSHCCRHSDSRYRKMRRVTRAQNISKCSYLRSSMGAASCSSWRAVTLSVSKIEWPRPVLCLWLGGIVTRTVIPSHAVGPRRALSRRVAAGRGAVDVVALLPGSAEEPCLSIGVTFKVILTLWCLQFAAGRRSGTNAFPMPRSHFASRSCMRGDCKLRRRRKRFRKCG